MLSHRFLPKLAQRELSPEGAGAFFRSFFTRNLSLKIFSLLLALTMWGFVASQRRGESTEFKFTTPLVLKNIPANLEVTSSLLDSVTVLVRVRRDLAKSVNPNQFQVAIDLRNQLPGEFEISLSEANIHYNNETNPQGVSVLQISPRTIPLVLEATIAKEVSIKPRFAGELARGFTIESITIKPGTVEVRGPNSRLDSLVSVPTRPLDVQDLRTDVEMLVALDLPTSIRLNTPKKAFFRAFIKVSDNPTRVLLRDIPILFENAKFSYKASISTLNIHLEGPRNVMDALERKDIFGLVNLAKYPPGDYRGLSPEIILPETVRVLEQWPILDLFVLKRKIEGNRKKVKTRGTSRLDPRAIRPSQGRPPESS